MTRLIDADELKKYIDDCKCCEKCDKIGFMCNERCEFPDFLTPQWERVLNEQPTVDAEPVRHGKWNTRRECVDGTFFTGCRCSECNYWKPMDIWKYCPNCGAKMGDEHGAD